MLEETVASLLADLGTDGVFGLLAFLEELGDLFEAGVSVLFFLLGFLNIVQEEFISFVIDFLRGALRLGIDEAFESVNPIYFLF